MVLINEKKFACATCIKGHRVSGCTHTDRPLFEVKKKGRPATQCQHCRDKRKTHTPTSSVVHTKCACGDPKPTNVLLPGASGPSGTTGLAYPSNDPPPNPNFSPVLEVPADIETKKGQPGSKATFPNGLKDVHEMAAAAEALSTLNTEEAVQVAERKVANLLNPCHCTTGGQCKCCQPKRDRADSLIAPSPSSSGARTPTGGITEGLSEMFRSKASTSATPPDSCCGGPSKAPTPSRPTLSIDSARSGPTWAQLMTPRDNYLSPDNMHHPAHTSRHVHKTKLYSPYSTSGNNTPRHGNRRDNPVAPAPSLQSGWASSSSPVRPPPPKLRPLADMNRFLGAMFREDGTVAEEIPRSALGLPGIKTFDRIAESGGVKIEPMEVDMDAPMSFPTKEDVVIGACTCGENCDCAGCATHGIPPRTGDHAHSHQGGCGDNCSSSFDCADHLSLPSGITSISHLLSIAAANVPHPAQKRPNDLGMHAHDTRVLPPSVHVNEDAARSSGFVTLKPLECCNGRCQCAPGKCTCEKECCGCCIRCACDEDGDTRMSRETTPAASAQISRTRCSTDAPTLSQPLSTVAASQGSCCSSNSTGVSPSRSNTATPPRLSPSVTPHSGTPPLLATDMVQPASRQPSPLPSNATAPASLRRSSSTTQSQLTASSGRRSTLSTGSSIHRSGSTGKQASKALALHTPPNHPQSGAHAHPRPILPKPSSSSSLGVPKSTNGSRVPSPGDSINPAAASASADTTRPFVSGQGAQADFTSQQDSFQLSDPSPSYRESDESTSKDMQLPDVDNDDFMAFINQLTASTDRNIENHGLFAPTTSSESSSDQALETPDITYDGQQPFDLMDFSSSSMSGSGMDGTSTSGLGEMNTDFIAMLTNALGSDGSQPTASDSSVPAVSHIQAPQQQMLSQRPQSQQSMHRSSASMYGPIPPPAQLNPHHSSHLPTQTGSNSQARNDQPLAYTAQEDTGFAVGLVEPFVFRQVEASRAAWSEPVTQISHQLPPQYTAMLQQMLGSNPAFGTQPPSPHNEFEGNGLANAGNMIDLSKPLNPTDVETILRALQDQQADPSHRGEMSKHVQTPSIGALPNGPLSNGSQPAPTGAQNRHAQPDTQYGPPPSLMPYFTQPHQQPGTGYADIPPNAFATPEDFFNRYILAQAHMNQQGHGSNPSLGDMDGMGRGMDQGMPPSIDYMTPWPPSLPADGEAQDQYAMYLAKGTGL